MSLRLAAEVRLLAETVPRQMDGDPAGMGTALITESPQPLPVLVPAGA